MASPRTPNSPIIAEGAKTGEFTKLRKRWMTGGSGHAQLLKAHISRTVKKEVKKHLKFNNNNNNKKPSPKKPSPKKPSPKRLSPYYDKLKYRLKLIQKLANNRTRRSENNAREVRRLLQNQHRDFRRNIISCLLYTSDAADE